MKSLFWVDLEMTGLNPESDVIIEAAALVTDLNFREIASYEAVLKQPQATLDLMDAWNQKHHQASGLLAKIPSGKDPTQVEQDLVKLVRDHFPEDSDKPILAGNSIAQDRAFINRSFKELSGLLHYRMLDVTAWKILFQNKFNKEFKKKQKHRALDDIRESIEELKFYLNFIRVD